MPDEGGRAQQAVAAWHERGYMLDDRGSRLFVVDVPARRATDLAPMFVLHGFPTCSYDWVHVLDDFSARRRVVLFDFPGFGLSSKPDVRYSIRMYADAAERVAAATGLERVVLVTHDMGDTVGGELLARDSEGALGFSIERRLLTNGSIYIEMAQLTAGQQLLLGLDDAPFDLAEMGLDPADGFRNGVAGTFAPGRADRDDMEAQWLFAAHEDGYKLLARTIRYIEDRRAEEARFTGAIERHPSPLGVVWGALDPVAVHPMTARLLAARPDTRLLTLDDVGHYPMVEAPAAFTATCADVLAEEA